MSEVYRVISSDGVTQHFVSRVEAELYSKDLVAGGLTAMTHAIPLPTDLGAFCDFLDRLADTIRISGRMAYRESYADPPPPNEDHKKSQDWSTKKRTGASA